MKRLLLQQMWPNCKLDFTTVHQELRDTDVTVDKLGFSSANAIIAQIVDQLRAEVLLESELEPQIITTTPSSPSENLPTANTVHSTSDSAIISLMASMMASMEEMRAQVNELYEKKRDGNGQFSPRSRYFHQERGYFNGHGRGRGCSPARGECMSHRSGRYCHTHLNCAHMGRECETRAEGHKETASFYNMMVGLNLNYDWLVGNNKKKGYTLINKLKTISQISVVSPFNSFTPYFNSYSSLTDTLASNKYLTEEALPFYQDNIPVDGPEVKVANGNTMAPILQTTYSLAPKLSPKAQHAFIFDTLEIGSLISIDQLCDHNCIELFTKYDLKIIKNNKVIVTVSRNNHGLWSIPLKKQTKQPSIHQTFKKPSSFSTNIDISPSVNIIIRVNQTKIELAQYLSGACFKPVPSNFLRAIRHNHFTSWPGLAGNLISKNLLKVEATVKDHLYQEKKNLRSTKFPEPLSVLQELEDIHPKQEENNI